MRINKTKYIANQINKTPTKNKKTVIVIGLTLRADSMYLEHLKHLDKEDNILNHKLPYPLFTITRKGQVYQHVKDIDWETTNFFEKKEHNTNIIPVLLENMGYLRFNESLNTYQNFIGETCEKENLMGFKWSGFDYWESFTEKQINTLVELCNKLCNDFNIEKNVIDFSFFHKNISNFNGICFRSNFIEKATDNNPLFDLEDFTNKIENLK